MVDLKGSQFPKDVILYAVSIPARVARAAAKDNSPGKNNLPFSNSRRSQDKFVQRTAVLNHQRNFRQNPIYTVRKTGASTRRVLPRAITSKPTSITFCPSTEAFLARPTI